MVVLSEGNIAEVGSFKTLLERGGTLSKMMEELGAHDEEDEQAKIESSEESKSEEEELVPVDRKVCLSTRPVI